METNSMNPDEFTANPMSFQPRSSVEAPLTNGSLVERVRAKRKEVVENKMKGVSNFFKKVADFGGALADVGVAGVVLAINQEERGKAWQGTKDRYTKWESKSNDELDKMEASFWKGFNETCNESAAAIGQVIESGIKKGREVRDGVISEFGRGLVVPVIKEMLLPTLDLVYNAKKNVADAAIEGVDAISGGIETGANLVADIAEPFAMAFFRSAENMSKNAENRKSGLGAIFERAGKWLSKANEKSRQLAEDAANLREGADEIRQWKHKMTVDNTRQYFAGLNVADALEKGVS